MGAKIDPKAVPVYQGTRYPKRFHKVGGDIASRCWSPVGEAAGLTLFGVNRCILPPGAASSLRHWHTHEDEFVVMLSGEAVLITDAGEETLRPGDMAGFPAGAENGHHLVNRTATDAVFLAIGNNSDEDRCYYADVDMIGRSVREGVGYVSRAGALYEDIPTDGVRQIISK